MCHCTETVPGDGNRKREKMATHDAVLDRVTDIEADDERHDCEGRQADEHEGCRAVGAEQQPPPVLPQRDPAQNSDDDEDRRHHDQVPFGARAHQCAHSD